MNERKNDMKANEAVQLVNKSVRRLQAYHLTPRPFQVKLNQNENPWDWPPEVKQKAADLCRSRPWNRYPDFIPDALKGALADFTGVSSDQVIIGNGSNEILQVLLLSLLNHDTPALVCEPTFTVYEMLIRGLGGRVQKISLRNDLSYDTASIVATAKENPQSILILASPNNPTGISLSRDDLETILRAHSGILVLDQAYVEFGGYNALELLSTYANLVVTRTFSKAMGGAGLRLGYMIAAPELIAEINKIKLPYNVNFFSDTVAQLLLSDHALIQERITSLRNQTSELKEILGKFPFDTVYPTDANFVLVRTSRKQQLFDFMLERGILLRDVSSYPMLENCIRISAGTPEEHTALEEALDDFFA